MKRRYYSPLLRALVHLYIPAAKSYAMNGSLRVPPGMQTG
jgi:hypothetical protein